MKIIKIADDSDLIRRLVAWKCPFRAEITGSTRTITVDRMNTKYICADALMGFETLGFIKQVKTRAEKSTQGLQPWTGRDVSYFRFADLRPGTYRHVIEIDVNGAYWELARRFGYLDQETYEKGLKVKKSDRLIAFGALATVKHVYEFDGVHSRRVGEEKNDLTRSFFFHVAKELDLIMQAVFDGLSGKVLFYWVDAFFARVQAGAEIQARIRESGLESKIKYIKKIEVSKQKDVTTIECYMRDGEIKPFFRRSGSKIEQDTQKYTRIVEEIKADIERGRVVGDILQDF